MKIKCSCGRLLEWDERVTNEMECSTCGLIHEVQTDAPATPLSARQEKETSVAQASGSWALLPVILGSSAAVLLIAITFLWALSSPGNSSLTPPAPGKDDSLAQVEPKKPGLKLAGTRPAPVANIIPPTTQRPAATRTAASRRDWYSENIGLIVAVVHSTLATKDGKLIDIEEAQPLGTCFAISGNGLLLTNRHVSQVFSTKPQQRKKLLPVGTLTFKNITPIACFGKDASFHHECKILHESTKFDLAILKIDRSFPNPIQIATQRVNRGDTVELIGYPGVINNLLTELEKTKLEDRILEQILRGNRVRYLDQIPESAYEPTLTRGEVSAIREIEGLETIQANVTSAGGNSGGPLLNTSRQAVGILTFGLKSAHTSGGQYSFAPSLLSMMDEIKPYLNTR